MMTWNKDLKLFVAGWSIIKLRDYRISYTVKTGIGSYIAGSIFFELNFFICQFVTSFFIYEGSILSDKRNNWFTMPGIITSFFLNKPSMAMRATFPGSITDWRASQLLALFRKKTEVFVFMLPGQI